MPSRVDQLVLEAPDVPTSVAARGLQVVAEVAEGTPPPDADVYQVVGELAAAPTSVAARGLQVVAEVVYLVDVDAVAFPKAYW